MNNTDTQADLQNIRNAILCFKKSQEEHLNQFKKVYSIKDGSPADMALMEYVNTDEDSDWQEKSLKQAVSLIDQDID